VPELPPAILLGGESAALSVTRSLGRAGVPVYAVGEAAWDPASASRYCTEFVDLGGKEGVEERWLEWLERAGARGAVILPTSDEAVALVARNRARLVELGYRPFEANDEIALAMLDKAKTYALARNVGIPVPRTATIRAGDELDETVAEIGFPSALKPLHSHLFAVHFGVRKKLWIVHDRRELEEILEQMQGLGLEMLLTEIIPGGDDLLCSYYTYLDSDGNPLFHFTRSKLRQYPPHFGIGCYQVTRWVPEVAELGLRFFQGIGLRGFAAFDLKRSAHDGGWRLIECNHRFTTATELTRRAGIEVGLFTYNRLVGRPAPPVDSFREGVRVWNVIEDTHSFLISRRRGELSFAGWVRSLLHRQHFPIFNWDDLGPSFAVQWRRLRRLGRRIAARWRPEFREA
jgi:D-aspartate ligase